MYFPLAHCWRYVWPNHTFGGFWDSNLEPKLTPPWFVPSYLTCVTRAYICVIVIHSCMPWGVPSKLRANLGCLHLCYLFVTKGHGRPWLRPWAKYGVLGFGSLPFPGPERYRSPLYASGGTGVPTVPVCTAVCFGSQVCP